MSTTQNNSFLSTRPAWHLLCQGEEGVLQEKLVTELVSLHRKVQLWTHLNSYYYSMLRQINTKESGFFFSALLTGVNFSLQNLT